MLWDTYRNVLSFPFRKPDNLAAWIENVKKDSILQHYYTPEAIFMEIIKAFTDQHVLGGLV